ncbi:MAG: hypothetical protein ACP5O8_02005 [Candidatus Aenigmatarchaeota archaeon]
MARLIVIIILIILLLLLFLNLDCIAEGMNRENKAFCIEPDFGLSKLGLSVSSGQGCSCFP